MLIIIGLEERCNAKYKEDERQRLADETTVTNRKLAN